MNPDLSRRVGAVMTYPPLCDLSTKEKIAFIIAVDAAKDFANLLHEYQQMIILAEKNKK